MNTPPGDRHWILMDDCGAFADHAATIYMSREGLDPGEDVRFGFRVLPHHCNRRPQCHGGMMSTFLDVALARGLRVVGDLAPPLPTISLSMEFMEPAALGAWVDARVTVNRMARTTGFVAALIHADGRPVMRGSGVFRFYRKAPDQT